MRVGFELTLHGLHGFTPALHEKGGGTSICRLQGLLEILVRAEMACLREVRFSLLRRSTMPFICLVLGLRLLSSMPKAAEKISSAKRASARANAGVRDFFERVATEQAPVFVSVVTIGELRRGVELIRHRGDASQANRLEKWLTGLLRELRRLHP